MDKVNFLTGDLTKKPVGHMLSNSTKPLEGKVAIITASTDEIGLAAAKQLLSDGATIMISGREQNNVDKALEELQQVYGTEKVRGLVCDVIKKDDRANLIKETVQVFGGIDILVSNVAANPTSGSVLDCEEDPLDKIFYVNLGSAFLLTAEVVPLMVSRGGGAIVYISSIAGVSPKPMLGASSISKPTLRGMTKVIANNLAAKNIRVNSVVYGIIKTNLASAIPKKKKLRENLLQTIPMRRFGRPDEIGTVVSFLCSSSSSFVTGEVIVASGGMKSRL